jgi:hypothetical protein
MTTADRDDTVARFSFDLEAFRIGTRDLWPRVLARIEERRDVVARALRRTLTHPRLPELVAAIRALPGTVFVDFEDDAGDLIRSTVRVGTGIGPEATLRLRDAELDQLLSGRATLLALAKARFVLSGDTGYLLRLLARLDGAP